MKIQTKFNVGYNVWVIKSGFKESTVANLTIDNITINVKKYMEINYRILGEDFNESVVFATKEELRKHFFGE